MTKRRVYSRAMPRAILLGIVVFFSFCGALLLPRASTLTAAKGDSGFSPLILVPHCAGDALIKVWNDSAWDNSHVPGITGTGTQGDPFIIADKVIDGSATDSCIWIENTTKYFVIRNCSVTNGAAPGGGIYLVNVSNGQVLNNNCSNNPGNCILLMTMCKNILVEGNNCSQNTDGIVLYNGCTNDTVLSNSESASTAFDGITISQNCSFNCVETNNVAGNFNDGIVVSNSTNNTVIGNSVPSARWYGIELETGANFTTVQGNFANGSVKGGGIHLLNSFNNTIINNNTTRNCAGGIFMEGTSANNTAVGNNLDHNDNGIYLKATAKNNTFVGNNATRSTFYGANVTAGSSGNWFYRNNFSENGVGQGYDAGSFTRWDNGSLGNFWSDYVGVDANDDGIGDTPYSVAPSAALDHFPIYDDGPNISPLLAILSPASMAVCNGMPPSFLISVTNRYAVATGYTFDSGVTNFTLSPTNGSIAGSFDAATWNSLPDGTVTLQFFTSNTAGNWMLVSLSLRKDRFAPVFAGTGLVAGEVFGSAAPPFSLSILGNNFAQVWYSCDGGATNYTCDLTGTLASGWAALGNGSVTVSFWAQDASGNVTRFDVVVQKDIAKPVITILYPAVGDVLTDGMTFRLSIAEANLNETWYTIGTDPAKHFFNGLAGEIEITSWASLPDGNVTIHFFANDTAGNEASVDITVVKQANGSDLLTYVVIGGIVTVVAVVGITFAIKKRRVR